ncbi:hypothetical protein [Natranaeroarchaeum aerophilus]|uniref:Uncharacterized protein n=1 Tax=Natranaeroarchaeum aerophilus TaxID=2917711 RepID=A0AAE3FRS5_9EURY|nr:hypothetical protein [Natranaeroarchaeum aerophilus]MCL9813905.1 hypothetical protein [Natranaeroarchaeum aerophilus]
MDLPPEPYAEYLDLLRDIGLPDDDIRSLHASESDGVGEGPLLAFVKERLDGSDPEVLARRLVDVLTQSRRGMNVTGSYWNYAPEVHLNEVFEPYGCSVTFRDATHGNGQSSFEVVLEDASGTGHRITFEYPETPLEDDNFPALLAAIERQLLSNTDLTFVLLRPIDRRWRVLLIENARLDRLRAEYGDRIEFAGVPLLREDQLDAFESGEATAIKPHVGETTAGTGRNRSTVDRRKRPDATDELLARTTGPADTSTPRSDADADPDAVFSGSPDDLAAQAGGENAGHTLEEVEASDSDLKQVFGDLSGVSLEPVTQEADDRTSVEEPVELGAAAAPDEESEPSGLDELFEQIEREALTDDDAAAPAGPGEGSAVVAAAGSGGSLLSVSETRSTPESSDGSEGTPNESAVDELIEEHSAADRETTSHAETIREAENESESWDNVSGGSDDNDASDTGDSNDDASGGFNWVSDDELATR